MYAWGFGGNHGGIFKYIPFFGCASPVGQGESGDVTSPRLVESLKENIKKIAAGDDLSLAVGESGKVYGWGQGLWHLGEEPTSVPSELSEINYFLDSHHAHVKKVKSAGKNAYFLLDDGRLYVTGINNGGAFATRQNPRVVVDNRFSSLTKIVDEDLHGKKITNFKVSANSLIFTTDSGEVFYSGMFHKFRPERFPVQQDGVQSIFATYDSVGVIDKEGRVSFLNDAFIDGSEKKGDVFRSTSDNLGSVIKMGGAYRLRYAVVRN